MTFNFVDIHCHILPGIDDGPCDWDESLAMARLAVDNGIATIVATPHQLGSFAHNRGAAIRPLVDELQQRLDATNVPLRVLPGGELRIETDLIKAVTRGEAVSLGDHQRHVLVELPHDLFLPIDALLADLSRRNIVAILAHPERNGGILRQPSLAGELVGAGCMMQLTAGSFCGAFGRHCQQLAEQMLTRGLVHFVATDGHGPRTRRPLMRPAFERIAELSSEAIALELCCHNPQLVASNLPVPNPRRRPAETRRRWFTRRAAG
jgi:protein-tyrosine phosphatase